MTLNPDSRMRSMTPLKLSLVRKYVEKPKNMGYRRWAIGDGL